MEWVGVSSAREKRARVVGPVGRTGSRRPGKRRRGLSGGPGLAWPISPSSPAIIARAPEDGSMLKLLTCSRGHYWEATVEDDTALAALACPECGEPADTLPLLDLQPTERDPTAPIPVQPIAVQPLFDARGWPIVAGFEVLEHLGKGRTGVHHYRATQLVVQRPVLLEVVCARDDPGQTAWGALRGGANAL